MHAPPLHLALPFFLALTLNVNDAASLRICERGITVQDGEYLRGDTEGDVGDEEIAICEGGSCELIVLCEGAGVDVEAETARVGDDDARDVCTGVVNGERGGSGLI